MGTRRFGFSLPQWNWILQNFPYDERKRREREALVEAIVSKVKTYTTQQGLFGDVYGRPKHIYSIYRKMRDKRNVSIRFLIWLPFVVSWKRKAMSMLWLAIFTSFGVPCQAASRIILQLLKLMATSRFIPLCMGQKDLLRFKSELRTCIKWLSTGCCSLGL